MSYALLLKENGIGCDYTFGCGWKPVMFDEKPTEDDIKQVVEEHGLDRFSNIMVMEITRVYTSMDLALLCGQDDDDDDVVDFETAERRAQYEKLKKEFG